MEDHRVAPGAAGLHVVAGLPLLRPEEQVFAELVGGVNGLVQRAAMWAPLGWMVAVSIRLYWLARPATAVETMCLGSAAK